MRETDQCTVFPLYYFLLPHVFFLFCSFFFIITVSIRFRELEKLLPTSCSTTSMIVFLCTLSKTPSSWPLEYITQFSPSSDRTDEQPDFNIGQLCSRYFLFLPFLLEENPFLIELQEADSCSIWLLPFVPCRLGFQSSRPFVVISTALILLFLFKLFILHTPWVRVLILFDSLFFFSCPLLAMVAARVATATV